MLPDDGDDLLIPKAQLSGLLYHFYEFFLYFVDLQVSKPLVFRYKIAFSLDGIDIALPLQLPVGPLDGIGIDAQLHRHAPHAGKLGVLGQGPHHHQFLQPVHDLLIDGPLVFEIQTDHSAPFCKVY